uniref:Uncharacterized protein n=1 Tax=Plesiomonas shigelloides TaxID=703 RepID=A0A4D6U7C6_PLESH|nr:hypothetical protein [Plesiomonas shigelloides]
MHLFAFFEPNCHTFSQLSYSILPASFINITVSIVVLSAEYSVTQQHKAFSN